MIVLNPRLGSVVRRLRAQAQHSLQLINIHRGRSAA
jgi:hypothetical protein